MSTAVIGPSSAPTLRLTRRGRLTVTLVFLGLMLAVLTAYGSTSAASGETGTPLPTNTVLVHEGDTLWGIAATVAEPGEVREVVHHIERLNALSGGSLAVGQELAVPAP